MLPPNRNENENLHRLPPPPCNQIPPHTDSHHFSLSNLHLWNPNSLIHLRSQTTFPDLTPPIPSSHAKIQPDLFALSTTPVLISGISIDRDRWRGRPPRSSFWTSRAAFWCGATTAATSPPSRPRNSSPSSSRKRFNYYYYIFNGSSSGLFPCFGDVLCFCISWFPARSRELVNAWLNLARLIILEMNAFYSDLQIHKTAHWFYVIHTACVMWNLNLND